MIHIDRGEAPAVFQSEDIEQERRKAVAFYEQTAAQRLQQRYKFRGLTHLPDVVDALNGLFHSKCAYCESLLSVADPVSIDRFRPCNGAVNLDGAFAPDHDWWLAYEWFNTYPVCQRCNSMKANRFPVAGPRVSFYATSTDLVAEQALLLDPCVDLPEQHLTFGKDGMVASETQQGRVTIDVVGLNRAGLIEQRREVYRIVELQLREFKQWLKSPNASAQEQTERINKLVDVGQPYIALRKQLLAQWLNANWQILLPVSQPMSEYVIPGGGSLSFQSFLSPDALQALQVQTATKERAQEKSVAIKTLQRENEVVKGYQAEQANVEAYSVEDMTRTEQYYRKRRLIERIELHNFRGIQDLTIRFGGLDAASTPWLLLLGENGTGKSSILQAITLSLMGDEHRQELFENHLLDAERFLRYGTAAGHVKVYFDGIAEPVELRFRKGSHTFEGNASGPKTPLLAYGATRLLPRGAAVTLTREGLARAHNLFNPFAPLRDADEWLSSLRKAKFDNVADGLKDLMLLGDDDRFFRTKKGEIKAHVLDRDTYLSDLSDGYQTVLALAIDIMSIMQERWELMEIAEGIVLIDELDAHLHPRWKMQIVKRLRRTFPRVQFIVTTHDPLCLRGFNQGEIVVMRRDGENRIVALTDLPDPNALRIEQILTSEYFGLYSTVDPEVEALFDEYYDLLALRERTPQQGERLQALKAQLDGRALLGSTPRERLMLEAADQFVAEQAKELDSQRRVDLADQARSTIVELWSALESEEEAQA